MLKLSMMTGMVIAFIGCATTPKNTLKVDNPKSFEDARNKVFAAKPDMEVFEQMGPFGTTIRNDFKVRLSTKEMISSDLFISGHKKKAPLLIFSHGNKSYKEAHRNQAIIASTWGFHALVLQLPNTHHWIRNSDVIHRVTKLIHSYPYLIDNKVDTDRIILVGHSFGGSAVSIAAGKGAPVAGLILLDPALISKKMKKYLRRVSVPTVLLGADPKVFRSKHRKSFYKNINSQMLEVSFKDATHDDAQNPSRFSLKAFGFDPFTSDEHRNRITSAIVSSAFSIANMSSVDFAYDTFRRKIASGAIIHPKKKDANIEKTFSE